MTAGDFGGAELSVESVTAGYRSQPIIFDISARFKRAQVTAIIGANGAGKSTLLKGIYGLARVFSGRLFLDGEPVAIDSAALARSGVAYVPQLRNVFHSLTVRENLEVGSYARGRVELDHAVGVFPVLGEVLGKQAGKLSVGQRNMLAVARALMADPKVLLLDEATGGLAPAVAEDLWQHVVGLTNRGIAVVVVEQNVDLALQYSSWAYVLGGGRVVAAEESALLRRREDFERLFLEGGEIHREQASKDSEQYG